MKELCSILLLLTANYLQAQTTHLAQAQSFAQSQKAAFEQNKGQVWDWNEQPATNVKYHFQQGTMNIFMLPTGMAYQFSQLHYPEGYQHDHKHLDPEERTAQEALHKQIRLETYRMDMELVNANPNATIVAEGKSKDYINYYNKNVLDVHSFSKLTYQEIYPGIDWVIYTTDKGLKYDFVVQAGADPSQIQLRFKDHEGITLNDDGSFTLSNRMGTITEQAPVSFQGEQQVATAFELEGNVISFQLGDYEEREVLVIDPSLVWATYYGGSGSDGSASCAVDNQGNVYLAGSMASTNNIASNGHQNVYGGGQHDAFLVKFNSNGVRQWATYYGGIGYDFAYSCTVDLQGNIYLAGNTASTNNIASNGHQNVYGGDCDAFLVKFNASGVRQWGTYYGDVGYDNGSSCAVDAQGNVYLAGYTESTNNIAFNGHQNVYGGGWDAFLVKFNGNGVRQWSTYYGGNYSDWVSSCVVDTSGYVYLVGTTSSTNNIALNGHQNVLIGVEDAFLVKFNANGVRQWATYYGGRGSSIGVTDGGNSCAVDVQGNVYLSGSTASTNNIAFNGHQNSVGGTFLVKFNAIGVRQWATYYGGLGCLGISCAVDFGGNVYWAGITDSSNNIPFNGHQNVFGGGYDDAFLVKFNANGVRQWGTYYGGGGKDWGYSCAVDAFGNVYLAGQTESTNNIASNGHQNIHGGHWDAFLAKFQTTAPPTHTITGSVRNTNGVMLGGITVSFTGSGNFPSFTTTTDNAGVYSQAVPSGWEGTVVPVYNLYSFRPRVHSPVVSNLVGQNFVGTRLDYTVSGSVRNSMGTMLAGVAVNFVGTGGFPSYTVTTDSNGVYSQVVLSGWQGTVVPSDTNYTFNPRTYSGVFSNLSNEDFVAMGVTYTVSGSVRSNTNVLLAGLTVDFVGTGGFPSFAATTDSSGHYSQVVPDGWQGSVVPVSSNYTFTPRTYSAVISNLTGQNFVGIGALVTYTITGSVRNTNGVMLGGITVSFTGSGNFPSFTTTTDNAGVYSQPVPSGWEGTVVPVYNLYSFNPRIHSPVVSNLVGQNFVGTRLDYTVSGSVRNSMGTMLAGVAVNFVGTGGFPSYTVTTDSNGVYSQVVLSGWRGTIEPSSNLYNFTARTYSGVFSNLTGQNFVGTRIMYTISGIVSDSTGNLLGGVRVDLTGTGGLASYTVTTDSNGRYSQTVPSAWQGSVIPVSNLYNFTARTYSSVNSNLTNQDFIGIRIIYTVSGAINSNLGVPLAGVVVNFVGAGGFASYTATTNSNGAYSQAVLSGWQGMVMPVASGYTFSARNYSGVLSNLTNQDFVGQGQTYTISGSVRSNTNVRLAGVAVLFTGSSNFPSFATTTNSNGEYSQAVPDGWQGTAVPSDSGYSFTPRVHSAVTSNLTGQNFVGSSGIPTYTITGSVRNTDGVLLGGITVTFTGSGNFSSYSTTTDNAGVYSQPVPSGWEGTVVPVFNLYSFNPRIHSPVVSNLTGQNFVGTRISYAVSGSVRGATNLPLSGAVVTFAGNLGTFSDTTSSNGTYTVSIPAGWSGTATASKAGYTFNSRTHSNISSNLTGQNFVDITGVPIVNQGSSKLFVNDILVQCYPNPNRGQFTIDWGRSYENVYLRVYDVSGQMIDKRMVYAREHVQLSINKGRGVYMVQISTEEGLLQTLKVVVTD